MLRNLNPLLLLIAVLLLISSSQYASSLDVSKLPPDTYVTCETTKGPIEIGIVSAWSPKGVLRFLELVDEGFLTRVPLFRCVANFLCQFGYKSGDESHFSRIEDDPLLPELKRFKRGYVSFAGGGKNTRDKHLFFTLGENVGSLGKELWETPIGFISDVSPTSTLAKLHTGYGDFGTGPKIEKIMRVDGAKYIADKFPQMDHINSCRRGRLIENTNLVDTTNKAEISLRDEAQPGKTFVIFELGDGMGTVKIELFLDNSFLGAPRFLNLAESGYLDGARFYRVVPGFVVQFGFPADPKKWGPNAFPPMVDEQVMGSNTRGVCYVSSCPR